MHKLNKNLPSEYSRISLFNNNCRYVYTDDVWTINNLNMFIQRNLLQLSPNFITAIKILYTKNTILHAEIWSKKVFPACSEAILFIAMHFVRNVLYYSKQDQSLNGMFRYLHDVIVLKNLLFNFILIIRLFNLLTLSGHDESYSRNVLCTRN
jgi:hypothetical protein